MAKINDRKLSLGSYGVSAKGATIAGLTKAYSDIAARDADTSSGMFAFVKDASADPSVNTGFAIYYRKANGWKKIFEEEAMDRDMAELLTIQWAQVVGRPESAPEQIDNAVQLAHEHANKELLDKLGLVEDHLTYNNYNLKADPTKYTKWLQLIRPVGVDFAVDCNVQFYRFDNDKTLQHAIGAFDSVANSSRFFYFNGEYFEAVVHGIPAIAPGRFVIVDIGDDNILKSESLLIRWIWRKHGDNIDTEDIVSSGLCIYPSITPSNTESVGLVWLQN